MDFRSVDSDVVPYGNIVSDLDSRFFIKGMEYGSVLYIYAVAYTDRVDVTTDDSIETFDSFDWHENMCYQCRVLGK